MHLRTAGTTSVSRASGTTTAPRLSHKRPTAKNVAYRTLNAVWLFSARVLVGLKRRLNVASTIRRERLALEQLSDRQLQDIGIDRATAEREFKRNLFDIPTHRMR